MITPADLDLPSKFSEFHPVQIEALTHVLESDKRVDGLNLQTGSGKSLLGVAIISAIGGRGVILTATKALMQQYENDFTEIGMIEAKGKANYWCADTHTTCRFGVMEGCKRRNSCQYVMARKDFCGSDLGITNYAYWIHSNKSAPLNLTASEGGPNPPTVLILDEGHDAYSQLASALQKTIRAQTFSEIGVKKLPDTEDVSEWVNWAMDILPKLEEDLAAVKDWLAHPPDPRRIQKYRELLVKTEACTEIVEELASLRAEEWICERRESNYGKSWEVDCIWPGAYAERYLFVGIAKILILSATLRPLSIRLLGVADERFSFQEWPRLFPAKNSPRYHLRTARLNAKTEQDESVLAKWLANIDGIIDGRLDRKGIIHTVSYKRQQYLLAYSRHKSIFWANSNAPDSESAMSICKGFKAADPPAVLVSPSFSTGWDFPDTDCEYQIISKLPFPGKSKIHDERTKRIPNYVNYLVMQDLIQACGRGTRSHDDKCEVFILDDSIIWFMQQCRHLAPEWFKWITVNSIPNPLPKMQARKAVA